MSHHLYDSFTYYRRAPITTTILSKPPRDCLIPLLLTWLTPFQLLCFWVPAQLVALVWIFTAVVKIIASPWSVPEPFWQLPGITWQFNHASVYSTYIYKIKVSLHGIMELWLIVPAAAPLYHCWLEKLLHDRILIHELIVHPSQWANKEGTIYIVYDLRGQF